MELKTRNKQRDRLKSLLAKLNTDDFENGASYVHPPVTEPALPQEKDARYLRDRVYAILRYERHALVEAGRSELIPTLERYSITAKGCRVYFTRKKVSAIYSSLAI